VGRTRTAPPWMSREQTSRRVCRSSRRPSRIPTSLFGGALALQRPANLHCVWETRIQRFSAQATRHPLPPPACIDRAGKRREPDAAPRQMSRGYTRDVRGTGNRGEGETTPSSPPCRAMPIPLGTRSSLSLFMITRRKVPAVTMRPVREATVT
jgi:hypothetical protein